MDLSSNNLHSFDPGWFESLGNLKILDLSHNNIETLDNFGFETNTNLNSLDLSFNKLQVFDITNLFKNKLGFQFLDLSNNVISEIYGLPIQKITINFSNNNIFCFNEKFVEFSKIFDATIINNNECNNSYNFSKFRLYSIPLKDKNEAFTIYIKLLLYTAMATFAILFSFWIVFKVRSEEPKQHESYEI